MPIIKVCIGFCSDLSGPYEDVDGLGGVDALRMAIEDMQDVVPDLRVELVLGDHKNDEQEASNIANRWFAGDVVDVLISGVNSDTSLAITAAAASHRKPVFVVGAGTSVQTRERSSPFTIQYAYNTVALGTVPGIALTQLGLHDWFFVTADYPFGRELQTHATAAIQSNDIHAMGLSKAQGIYFADTWFWTRDKATRSWAQRFQERNGKCLLPSRLPTTQPPFNT